MYKLSKIQKSFTQGDTIINVLKGIDLEVSKGDSVSIVGQSGSGKSTLLSVLSGLESVDSGEVSFENRDLTSESEEALTVFVRIILGLSFNTFI